LTFVKAQTFLYAQPLVMRGVDTRFTTYFVTRADGPLRDCDNLVCDALAGKVFSFEPKLSTSGHLMPRHFLKAEKRIEPESFFC
jgi:phosphonate transport system substrate-binding protein